jgi:hypothetical protein
MAAKLGHDTPITLDLWVQCDRCHNEIVGFGLEHESRSDLEFFIEADTGWHHLDGDNWFCDKCRASPPQVTDTSDMERRSYGRWPILRMPD